MVISTSSSSFVLEFVTATAWKDGVKIEEGKSYSLQEITEIITELKNTFEKWPIDIAMVKKEATVKIREWLRQRILIHSFMINPLHLMKMLDTVKMKVEGPDRGGRVKTVWIHLLNYVLKFKIKKKQKMSLRTLAAEKISSFITKREDIKKLEVPIDVMDDLNEAYDDCWRVQYKTADSTEEPKTII